MSHYIYGRSPGAWGDALWFAWSTPQPNAPKGTTDYSLSALQIEDALDGFFAL